MFREDPSHFPSPGLSKEECDAMLPYLNKYYNPLPGYTKWISLVISESDSYTTHMKSQAPIVVLDGLSGYVEMSVEGYREKLKKGLDFFKNNPTIQGKISYNEDNGLWHITDISVIAQLKKEAFDAPEKVNTQPPSLSPRCGSLIVNLSSIFKLKPVIPDGLSPFVKLCNDYSESKYLCGKTLFGISNNLWVLKQYYANQKLFDDYKLGKIKNEQFLDALLNIFSFLKNNKKVADPKKLLATAWNEIIVWNETATSHLQQLLDCANRGEKVYLISNTNPLNIEKILTLFKENSPGVKWNTESLQTTAPNTPVEIAPNMYLCLSYQYGLFKEGTPGLLKTVVQQTEAQEKVTVVSQYPKDLEVARNLHLNVQEANEFYTQTPSLSARLG